ncbi:cysteine hydrolase family protein [soil metagenome]
MTTALLVIDVQQALCTGDNAAFDVDGVVQRINEVSRKARAAGAPVVVIQHETRGGDMDHGTDGWKLPSALQVEAGDVFMRKTASDAFLRTELQDILQSRGVTRLVICGLHSEFCIDSTTRRAMALGYPVVLVSDGHSTLDNGVLKAAQITAHHNKALSSMESFGPRTTPVRAIDVGFSPALGNRP